jgi:hypothetical protein
MVMVLVAMIQSSNSTYSEAIIIVVVVLWVSLAEFSHHRSPLQLGASLSGSLKPYFPSVDTRFVDELIKRTLSSLHI